MDFGSCSAWSCLVRQRGPRFRVVLRAPASRFRKRFCSSPECVYGRLQIMSRNSSEQPSRDTSATGQPPSAAADEAARTGSPAQQAPEITALPHSAAADPLGNQPTVISSRPHPELGPAGPTSAGQLGQQLVGARLAHFELTEFVGGGGMGAVFRATDTMLNRTVAVKVLSRDQGQDEETVKRFRNEAQSAARLDHENIARVYFVGEDDGWYFIVFEFIEGQNLRDLVADQGALSLEQSLNITLQVAAALDHAARREVVHRDIKPSNVLLTASGRAKLVDMGLARLQPMRTGEDDLTASGVTLGTFDYISPEQARDPRTADVRSDIYSLGCTLFFMLTGRPPFARGTVLQKLLSHSAEPPPDPRNLRPDLPEDLLPVLSKMLAKSPADRYGSPGELMGELWLLAERLGLPTVIHAQPVWIPAGRHRPHGFVRHLPWVVPVGLMAASLLLIDPAWLAGKPDLTDPPRFEVPRPSAPPAPGPQEPWPAAAAETELPGVISPVAPANPFPSTISPNASQATEESPTTTPVGRVGTRANCSDRQRRRPCQRRPGSPQVSPGRGDGSTAVDEWVAGEWRDFQEQADCRRVRRRRHRGFRRRSGGPRFGCGLSTGSGKPHRRKD